MVWFERFSSSLAKQCPHVDNAFALASARPLNTLFFMEAIAEATAAAFDTIDEAVTEIAAGRPVIVTDDENRENEGDLVMAASLATPETVNLMIRQAGGLICVPTVEHQLRRLGIQRMVAHNREAQGTDFTVSVDAAAGITTGISAYDRCRTIQLLGDPASTPEMLVAPGHVFPLQARPGGVLQRAGHTEAAVDLALLAGLPPVGVICEVLNDDGSVARLAQLISFKQRHGLKMVSIAQLIQYRHQRDRLIEPVTTQPFVTVHGTFQLHLFRSTLDNRLHAALSLGALNGEPTLVRVQSQNLLSEILAGEQAPGVQAVEKSLRMIAQAGRGVLLYVAKANAGLMLPSDRTDGGSAAGATMDQRDYGIGAQILSALGLRKICLITSSQRRLAGLDGYGLEIVQNQPLS